MTRRPLWSIPVQSFMLHRLQHLEQTAYLMKLSRSKLAYFRRKYSEEGMMANNSWRYRQPDKSDDTLINWKINCSSQSKPLSLSLHKDCHIRRKYTSHCTSIVNFWVLVCFGEGSGQLSLLSTSQRKSSGEKSSQVSGSCSSSLPSSGSESFHLLPIQKIGTLKKWWNTMYIVASTVKELITLTGLILKLKTLCIDN